MKCQEHPSKVSLFSRQFLHSLTALMDSPSPQLKGKLAKRNDDGPLLPNDVLALIAVSGNTALFATMALCSRALHSQLRSPHFISLARQQLLTPKWFDSRRKKIDVNKAGRKHGTEEHWNDAGVCTYLAHWREDQRHGAEEERNDAGVRTHLSHWREGKRHGTEEKWNNAGVRTQLVHWHKGALHGTDEKWNDAGVRTQLAHWHQGTLHGTEEKWNNAGVRIKLLHRHDGKLHGTSELWDDEGILIHRSHWHNDKKHGTREV